MIASNRNDAIEFGLKRYFTGKPCKFGHVCERHTANFCCVECNLENYRKWSINNPEKERERSRKKLKPSLSKSREAQRRYRLKNRDSYNAMKRKWYSENVEKISLKRKKWRKENPEKAAAASRKKDALRRCAKGTFSQSDIDKIYQMQKGRCVECKSILGKLYHVDHIMPISKGGTNWPKNLQCLCPTCNMKKGAKHPIDWALQNGRLV